MLVDCVCFLQSKTSLTKWLISLLFLFFCLFSLKRFNLTFFWYWRLYIFFNLLDFFKHLFFWIIRYFRLFIFLIFNWLFCFFGALKWKNPKFSIRADASDCCRAAGHLRRQGEVPWSSLSRKVVNFNEMIHHHFNDNQFREQTNHFVKFCL